MDWCGRGSGAEGTQPGDQGKHPAGSDFVLTELEPYRGRRLRDLRARVTLRELGGGGQGL